MRLFPETRASRAKARISSLEHVTRMSENEEATSEKTLRTTLETVLLNNDKYRPSVMAASMGWRRHG